MHRRPSGLIRQLDWLWKTVEELKGESLEDSDAPPPPPGEPNADPGDLEVYFENGLAGD